MATNQERLSQLTLSHKTKELFGMIGSLQDICDCFCKYHENEYGYKEDAHIKIFDAFESAINQIEKEIFQRISDAVSINNDTTI